MNAKEKRKTEKESEITRLKEKWRTLDETECDQLRDLLFAKGEPDRSCDEIAARFNARLNAKQLRRMRDWVEWQDILAREAEIMEAEEYQFKEVFGDKLPMDEIREIVLWRSYKRSVNHNDSKLGLQTMRIDQTERALKLKIEMSHFDVSAACKEHLPEFKLICSNPKLSEREKINQIRRKLFGPLPEDVRKEKQNEEARN
jgi:hypothetical protein